MSKQGPIKQTAETKRSYHSRALGMQIIIGLVYTTTTTTISCLKYREFALNWFQCIKFSDNLWEFSDSIPGVGGDKDEGGGTSKEEQQEQERLRQEAIREAEKERRMKYKKQEEERETIRQTIRDKVRKMIALSVLIFWWW